MSKEFGQLSQLFTSHRTMQDTDGLLRELMKFSYELDDEGNPVMVDIGNGKMVPKSDGTVGRFIDNTFQIGLNHWLDKAEKSGNADLKAACEYIKEEYDRASGSAQPPDYSQLDEQTRARLQEADRREKELADRQAADETRKTQEFEVKVATSIDSKLNDEIGKLLGNATLTDTQKKWAVDQIKERVSEKLKNSPLFFNKLDVIMRRPMSEKTMQSRVKHGIDSARPLLNGAKGIVAQVLTELGVSMKASQEAARAKVDTQQQAARSEIKAGSQPAKPGDVTAADINRMAREELVKEGKDPNRSELMFQKVFAIKQRLGAK